MVVKETNPKRTPHTRTPERDRKRTKGTARETKGTARGPEGDQGDHKPQQTAEKQKGSKRRKRKETRKRAIKYHIKRLSRGKEVTSGDCNPPEAATPTREPPGKANPQPRGKQEARRGPPGKKVIYVFMNQYRGQERAD